MNKKHLAILGSLVILGSIAWGALVYVQPAGREAARPGSSWRGRGQVSDFLLELTRGGPKGLSSIQVPEGFEVELAAGPDLVSYGVFASFDDRGRLFICQSSGKNMTDEEMAESLSFRISVLEDLNGDGVFDHSKVFADNITMALGALWYRGSLYSAQPPDFVRYDDSDDDGVADHREVLLTGWPLKANATTLHGPYLGPDGWMHLTYSPQAYEIQTKEGTTLKGPGGRVFRTRPDGTRLEWFVGGGFANPVEVVFTEAGEPIGTVTIIQPPSNGVRDALLHYIDGAVFPRWRPMFETAYQQTGDPMPPVTKLARVAPAGLARYRGSSFGPEYQGNLFSAQFNPHLVQRHILHRDGGTFRSEDEDFLTSADIDLHVTDVIEDADGSLLVLDTGAWYLHGCPVSRISKPEFKGAIYRVRKRGAPRIEDPWGKRTNLESLPAEGLAKYLEDPRPMVRDRALDLLIQAGPRAVGPLVRVRESDASAEVRASAVFGLGRIHDPRAAEAVRQALGDSDLVVRIAAARMAGLNEDAQAVDRLMEMVKADEPASRRQAAEALGRIADPRAIPSLLAASADPEDRFVEHSVIYALIRLERAAPLIEALGNRNPRVRKAALIALDQMEGKPLRREHLIPLLTATDEHLSSAVLWVAARHPEWSGDIVGFLRARLLAKHLSAREQDSLHRALVTFCGDSSMQNTVAELLASPKTNPDRQLFLLDAIDNCSPDEMPPVWVDVFRRLIEQSDSEVRQQIAEIVGTRGVSGLDEQLEKVAANETESNDLRTATLRALVSRRPALGQEGFKFLVGLLKPATGADLRLSAAQVLSKARLSREQLLILARDYVPRADALVLPTLVNAFRHTREEEVGQALVAAMLKAPESAGGMAGQRLQELLKNFPRPVAAAAKPLLEQVEREEATRAERLRELEPLLNAGGDVARGRAIFFGAKAACSSCHTIGTEGEDVGPDLTAVGAVRSGLDILEAIVFPSASFVPNHEVYRVETATDVYTGLRGPRSEEAVVLIAGPRDRVRILQKDIVSIGPSPVSLMPDGFDEDLTRQELTDLLAFLQAQKSRPSAVADDD